MKRKKIIISAIVAATVIMVGGGGVYAYNCHQEQVEQQKLEEQEKAEEKERLKQEEQKRKEEEEKKRLEDARKVIDQDLKELEAQVVVLYEDNQKEVLVEGITQDSIDTVSEKLEILKDKYNEDPDITPNQTERLKDLEEDLQNISKMYEVLTSYNVLYPNGQLVAPGTEAKEAVENLRGLLKALQDEKSDFCKVYEEKLSEVESSFAFQRSVQEAVNMIYDKEVASMVAGVTRQQYNDVLAAVETMPDNELKAELRQYLIVVDQILTAQEEVAKIQKASSRNNSGNGSSSSGSGSSNGNKTSSGGNNSSGSKGSSGKGSSVKGSSGGGSSSSGSGSSGGGNSSSGSGNSSGGNNSSGSGSSGSSNSSSGNGSSGGGNNSSGNNDLDGYGSWEGTITGGGETKGGGTWESFEW